MIAYGAASGSDSGRSSAAANAVITCSTVSISRRACSGLSRHCQSETVDALRHACESVARSSIIRCSSWVSTTTTACRYASTASLSAGSGSAASHSFRVDACAARHHRSRPVPSDASSTMNPCAASCRRWYDATVELQTLICKRVFATRSNGDTGVNRRRPRWSGGALSSLLEAGVVVRARCVPGREMGSSANDWWRGERSS